MHFQRHPMGHFAILGAEDALMSDQLSLCPNLTTSQQGTLLSLAAKDTPWTGPPFLAEMVPSIVAEDGIALGVYCWLAEVQRHYFATRKTPLNSSCVLQCSGKGAT